MNANADANPYPSIHFAIETNNSLALKRNGSLHILADRYDDSTAISSSEEGSDSTDSAHGGHFERMVELGESAIGAKVTAEFDGKRLKVVVKKRESSSRHSSRKNGPGLSHHASLSMLPSGNTNSTGNKIPSSSSANGPCFGGDVPSMYSVYSSTSSSTAMNKSATTGPSGRAMTSPVSSSSSSFEDRSTPRNTAGHAQGAPLNDYSGR